MVNHDHNNIGLERNELPNLIPTHIFACGDISSHTTSKYMSSFLWFRGNLHLLPHQTKQLYLR